MDFALGQNAKSIDTWNRPKPILGHLRCIESSSETFSQISKFRKNDGLGDFFDFRSLRLSIGNMTKCGKIINMQYGNRPKPICVRFGSIESCSEKPFRTSKLQKKNGGFGDLLFSDEAYCHKP